MISTLTLPQITDSMRTGIVHSIYATSETLLTPGYKLFDIRIDASLGIVHDCPPISFHRIALREPVWLRQMLVCAGDEIPPDTPLAIFSSTKDEPIDLVHSRPLRVSIFGTIPQDNLWDQPR